MTTEGQLSKPSSQGRLTSLRQSAMNMSIRAKLVTGFATILIVVFGLVAYVQLGLSRLSTVQTRVIETRMPTNIAGHDLVNGINFSLAALRGYMILNDDRFKSRRALAWKQIDENLALLNEKSKNWTVARNKQRLAELKAVLDEFRAVQLKVETVANSVDEQPANKILFEDAAPRAVNILTAVTGLIDVERQLEPTKERRRLLVTLADSRGSFATGLANIRAYLLSGEERFKKNFETNWAVNTDRFGKLREMVGLMTGKQQAYFKTYVALRGEFAPLPDRMFKIRASNKWNTANLLLGAEAAPRAEKALGILSEMVASQNELVRTDVVNLKRQNKSTRNGALLGGVLVAMLALFAGFLVVRAITVPLRKIVASVGRLASGKYDERVDVGAKDEIGVMAEGLNEMLDRILVLIQTGDERDKIQRATMKLLEEISDVAGGDLTVEAEVTEDMTGALADSFNFMILELRTIIGEVQAATSNMTTSATGVSESASKLADDNKNQFAQIHNVAAAVDEMATSIRVVSDNATQSTQVAAEALNHAKVGAAVVNKTVDGMNVIRRRVQETSKRIKRLGESSQEIGEIVELIKDIADRTSMLALNASIQAAMAGEAGRGFAVVAEEVERLAEQAGDATKRISILVGSIQSETNEAGASMEATTHEVVLGSELAAEAGVALQRIHASSEEIAHIAVSISTSANEQVRGAETVSQSISDISNVTGATAEGAKLAAVSILDLVSIASKLNSSLGRFKLPEQRG